MRQAACQAENQYQKLLAARTSAARSRATKSAAPAVFNPLRPTLPDWQRVLEQVAAQLKPAAAKKVRRVKTTAA